MSTTVGIAIPAYGRGRHLRQTLESVLAQTRPATQIIVVDDCSPDETADVARSFEERGVTYVRNPVNLGVPANYNASLGRTTADYVMILEDHDLLAPSFIEKCAGLMDDNPEVSLVATAIAQIEEQTGRVVQVFTCPFQTIEKGQRLAEFLVTHTTAPLGLTALIRRSVLGRLKTWFDPKYWWYADIDLWIRLALRGSFGYIHEPLLNMREREPDHFLRDRGWQSLVCCDRIRRDNWREVFPENGFNPMLNWVSYCTAREYESIRLLLSRIARGEKEIPTSAWEMLSPMGRLLVSLLSRTPRVVARALRTARRVVVPSAGSNGFDHRIPQS